MSLQKKYYANTDIVNISTANSNLDGTGSLGTIVTAGYNGLTVSTVIIKAIGNTSLGMVRLFVNDGGGNIYLCLEIPIPEVIQTAVSPAYQIVITSKITLESGHSLQASTQNAESFNVMANGYNWENCDCPAAAGGGCKQSVLSTANTGLVNISTANSNLDGSGSLGTFFTSPSIGASFGSKVNFITIKSTGDTMLGMVRLFMYNGINSSLFWEVPIPANDQSSVVKSFRATLSSGILISPGFELRASTQNAESFNVIANGHDIDNCLC